MRYLYGVSEKCYDHALHRWEMESEGMLILEQAFWFEVLGNLKQILLP